MNVGAPLAVGYMGIQHSGDLGLCRRGTVATARKMQRAGPKPGSQRVSGHAMSKREIAHELVLGWDQLVVHGAVAHQAVCDRYEDPLQDRVPVAQRTPGQARVVAAEQPRPRADRWPRRLSAERARGGLHPRVAAQAFGLPRRVPGAKERAAVGEDDAHGRADGRAIALVDGEEDRLGPHERARALGMSALRDRPDIPTAPPTDSFIASPINPVSNPVDELPSPPVTAAHD
jgi:hypothetical protein